MELFIRIENGAPVEHPIFGDNFREAFPNVDVNNLPDWAARFVRVPPPQPPVYQKLHQQYGWVDGVVKDIWTFVDMTPEEREEVDRLAKAAAELRAIEASESQIGVSRV